jgi:hypothetical protein
MEVNLPYKQTVKAHDDAMNLAAIQREASTPPGSSQATYKAADLAFARAALASCIANNNYSSATQFTAMLKSLGVNT